MMPDTASLWTAAKRFEGILRKDPGAYSFAPLADIYRQLGLLQDALDTARSGAALHPGFAAGQLALAKAALEFTYTDEATKALEAVVRITPENLAAQRLLADLYAADGNEAAALHCRAVADSLDPDFREAVVPDDAGDEEFPDADILELSDELIEEDDGALDDPFAALPDRPSLGDDFHRAEPFLLETAPRIHHDEPEVEEPITTMATATIAELYVSQGFPERGADVYRELLAADPSNSGYKNRLIELTQPAGMPAGGQQSVAPEGVLEKLTEWLGNIGRVRECRTRNL